MKAEEVIERFRKTGALLEGHFVLTSGLHSPIYLQCALVLQQPRDAEEFGRSIAEYFQAENIQTVASPAIGGIVIGHETARALGAKFIWTERQDGVMILRRGFSVSPGESERARASFSPLRIQHPVRNRTLPTRRFAIS